MQEIRKKRNITNVVPIADVAAGPFSLGLMHFFFFTLQYMQRKVTGRALHFSRSGYFLLFIIIILI